MRGVADEVGRAQVQPQLRLEVLDRRLVHAPARGEAADEVDDRAQRRLAVARGERGHRASSSPRRRGRRARARGARGRAARSRSAASKTGTTTRQPASRNAWVTAAPRPPVPPVMSALEPCRNATPRNAGPSASLATVSHVRTRAAGGAAVDCVLLVREAELRASATAAIPAPRPRRPHRQPAGARPRRRRRGRAIATPARGARQRVP